MTKRRSCDAAAAEAVWRRRREQGAPMGASQVTRRYTVELRHQPQMRGEAELCCSEAFFSKDLKILKRLLIISSKISTSGGRRDDESDERHHHHAAKPASAAAVSMAPQLY